MRFQPFNTAKRLGEDQFALIDRAIECLEEEILHQRAINAVTFRLHTDRAAAAADRPGLRRPLFSDVRKEIENLNEYKNRAMDAYARVPTGTEEDKDGQPRQAFHTQDQRFDGWMTIKGREAENFEAFFTLVDCTPDGTRLGQNYEAHQSDSAGHQRSPNLHVNPVEREYVNKRDVRMIFDDIRNDARQVAMGADAPSTRHTFPLVLLTDSYPAGASHLEKEEWAVRVTRMLRRHFGWGVRLDAFLKAFREVGWPEGGGAVPRASPPTEGSPQQLVSFDSEADLTESER